MRSTFVHPESKGTVREVRLAENHAVERRIDAVITLSVTVARLHADAS